ncbi:hypothetical protein TSH58p_03455 [Azospirillum sp. TSH58]|nr:hypothetical protein TSH58p_03455 [Azospirillum sp. TSH58]
MSSSAGPIHSASAGNAAAASRCRSGATVSGRVQVEGWAVPSGRIVWGVLVASLSLFESDGDEPVPDGAGSLVTLGMVDSLPARLIKPALAVQPRCRVCDEALLPPRTSSA